MSDVSKIKSRKSYKEFKTILKLIENGNKEMLLRTVYNMLDSKNAYGSRTMSLYAGESLEQVIKEMKNEYSIHG